MCHTRRTLTRCTSAQSGGLTIVVLRRPCWKSRISWLGSFAAQTVDIVYACALLTVQLSQHELMMLWYSKPSGAKMTELTWWKIICSQRRRTLRRIFMYMWHKEVERLPASLVVQGILAPQTDRVQAIVLKKERQNILLAGATKLW